MQILIVDEEAAEQLAELNASGPVDRRLETVELGDGRRALNADLLEDCAPGQTWDHWAAFLDGLEIDEVEASEFVTEAIS